MNAPAAPDDAATTGSNDVSHAARSGAVQTLTIAAQALLTVTHVLLARLFGTAVFGSYQTCLAILEMLTRAGPGGADKGMLRYVAAHRAQGEPDLVRRALGTGLRLALLTAGTLAVVLMATAGVAARAYHQPALAAALRVMAPAALFTGCVYVLVNASLAAKVTWANFVVRGLGEPLLMMAAGLAAAVLGRKLLNLAVAHVLAAATTFTLAVAVVGRVFGRGEIARALRSPGLPGFVRFSVPLGAAELMNAILQRADVVLLTAFVGPSTTAVYAAAEFISRIIGNPRNIFDGIAAPVFSEAVHLGQRDRLGANLLLMSRWVATAAAPIGVTAIALRHDLLSLYGPAFQAGAVAIVVLAISQFINATFGLAGYVLVASGRSQLLLANNVLVAIVNILLNVILIPRFGLVGAALAALGGVLLLHTLVLIEVGLMFSVYPVGPSTLKPIAAALAMFAAESAVGAYGGLPAALQIPVAIVAGLVAYLSALVALGLAPEERGLLEKWRRRTRRRIRPGQ